MIFSRLYIHLIQGVFFVVFRSRNLHLDYSTVVAIVLIQGCIHLNIFRVSGEIEIQQTLMSLLSRFEVEIFHLKIKRFYHHPLNKPLYSFSRLIKTCLAANQN